MNPSPTGRPSSALLPLSSGHIIYDENGESATVQSVDEGEDRIVLLRSGKATSPINVPLSLIEQRNTRYCIPLAFKDLENAQGLSADKSITIPVWEETIEVGKEMVDTGRGVRISKQVEEHDEEVTVQLLQDSMEIEHVPIRKILPTNELPSARQEGDTYIVPVFKEVLVVEKKICLEEEIHIRRNSRQDQHTQSVSLKSESVKVERFDETPRSH